MNEQITEIISRLDSLRYYASEDPSNIMVCKDLVKLLKFLKTEWDSLSYSEVIVELMLSSSKFTQFLPKKEAS